LQAKEREIAKQKKQDQEGARLGETVEPYPAPFWEEKLAHSHDFIAQLIQIPCLRHVMTEDPDLVEEFMMHPDS